MNTPDETALFYHLDEILDEDQIEHFGEMADERGVDIGVVVSEFVNEYVQRELGN